jgi:hypothetical protein
MKKIILISLSLLIFPFSIYAQDKKEYGCSFDQGYQLINSAGISVFDGGQILVGIENGKTSLFSNDQGFGKQVLDIYQSTSDMIASLNLSDDNYMHFVLNLENKRFVLTSTVKTSYSSMIQGVCVEL